LFENRFRHPAREEANITESFFKFDLEFSKGAWSADVLAEGLRVELFNFF
jgi:hypothetical protein